MKKFTLLLLFFANLISGQETDSIISQEIKVLKEKKIDSFFILEKYCNGCIKLIMENEKDCDYGTSKIYVFWKEKENAFYKKIDKCDSSKVKISTEIFNDFLTIKNETVKPYQTENNGYVNISHSTFSLFYFNIDEKIVVKKYDHFDLTNNKEEPNINFKHNKSLALVKLDKKCDKIINHKK